MPEEPDSNPAGLREALAGRVREASLGGQVLRLEQVWEGTADEFLAWRRSEPAAGMDDIALIQEGGEAFLYSELHMTRSYAESAARAGSQDICRAIVQTVRSESRTYPRPTPLTAFSEPPFMFSKGLLDRAVQEISGNPDYADIRLVHSSDGSVFLFSSAHMDAAHAESLAEWIAVGHLRNP